MTLPRRDALLLAELDGVLAGLVDAAGDCVPATRVEAARMLIQLGLRALVAAEGAGMAAAHFHVLAARLRPHALGAAPASCSCQVVWAEPRAGCPAQRR